MFTSPVSAASVTNVPTVDVNGTFLVFVSRNHAMTHAKLIYPRKHIRYKKYVKNFKKNDRYGRHIFSPNEDDLSYSVRTIFSGNIKMVKARQTISSSEPFEQDGRTFCLLPS